MPPKTRASQPAESTSWLRKSTLLFFLLLLVIGFLGGLIWAGRWGVDQLRDHDRYVVPFAEIECDHPADLYQSKQEFLDEVLYTSRLPQRFHLLDRDLPSRLREGFAKHPWVESVESVEIRPPKQIVVKLIHRKPVLAVKVGSEMRAVDGNGVLLRKDTPTRGLPVYDGEASPPQGIEGTRWGDPDVEAAARKLKK